MLLLGHSLFDHTEVQFDRLVILRLTNDYSFIIKITLDSFLDVLEM